MQKDAQQAEAKQEAGPNAFQNLGAAHAEDEVAYAIPGELPEGEEYMEGEVPTSLWDTARMTTCRLSMSVRPMVCADGSIPILRLERVAAFRIQDSQNCLDVIPCC